MPIRFRTGPEIQRLKREIESYVKRYFPNSVVKFVDENPYLWTAYMKPLNFRIGKYLFVFNERYLEWMPRDKVFEVIKHELAHRLVEDEFGREGASTEQHGPEWEKHARILGIETPDIYTWWNWLRGWGITVAYPRFLFKCRDCGIQFYTDGYMRSDNYFFDEPRSHPPAHINFWVWDTRSGRRGVIRINRMGSYDENRIFRETKFEGEE